MKIGRLEIECTATIKDLRHMSFGYDEDGPLIDFTNKKKMKRTKK